MKCNDRHLICKILHFKRRMRERCGIDLGAIEYHQMLNKIQKRKECFCVLVDGKRKTHWVLLHDGKNYLVVYDEFLKMLVTAYPFKDICHKRYDLGNMTMNMLYPEMVSVYSGVVSYM